LQSCDALIQAPIFLEQIALGTLGRLLGHRLKEPVYPLIREAAIGCRTGLCVPRIVRSAVGRLRPVPGRRRRGGHAPAPALIPALPSFATLAAVLRSTNLAAGARFGKLNTGLAEGPMNVLNQLGRRWHGPPSQVAELDYGRTGRIGFLIDWLQ
jgi:hypothetical protein